jgi:hypothetical protein
MKIGIPSAKGVLCAAKGWLDEELFGLKEFGILQY